MTIDEIKRDIDKESEIIREAKIYEEESGLLEEDKIWKMKKKNTGFNLD